MSVLTSFPFFGHRLPTKQRAPGLVEAVVPCAVHPQQTQIHETFRNILCLGFGVIEPQACRLGVRGDFEN